MNKIIPALIGLLALLGSSSCKEPFSVIFLTCDRRGWLRKVGEKAIVDEIKVQKDLELLHKDDMDFIEALDKNFLVYREVKALPEFNPDSIPYIQVRPSLSQVEKDNIKILTNK